MKLQTTIPLKPVANQINYDSKILLIGSCFTENIGEKLAYFKFQSSVNPFGIVFHPLAIEQLIHRAIHQTLFTETDVFERDGQWFCFETHSSVTETSKEQLIALLNNTLLEFASYVRQTSHIIFTYGTAWVYRHVASNAVVANCHKLPQKEFTKELLSMQEISASIARTVSLLSEINSTVKIITTVSPVRHLKDGFVENTQGKAHLIAGIHTFMNQKPIIDTLQTHYFPSYEIMMDELRDYRFYGEDMIHPSKIAVDYIWDKFQLVWIASETLQLQKEVDVVQKGLQHRPFYPNGEAHVNFQQDLQQKVATLQTKLPHVTFD
ncbi:GSCFA domain-containing protein [Rasiella rasia]|uniref:GSCFA domain-containing protein n=1 Tax=Rasiella rasia TaxID=2744027 RepID=A0A6G6GKZ8_9FLAO|nr:GSCFA domain-containing protein [Rasiella rasia]QIE59266.1 GSCFA domain-containing protein [Rasiella rasia]